MPSKNWLTLKTTEPSSIRLLGFRTSKKPAQSERAFLVEYKNGIRTLDPYFIKDLIP